MFYEEEGIVVVAVAAGGRTYLKMGSAFLR
jgi:hypothetical protein